VCQLEARARDRATEMTRVHEVVRDEPPAMIVSQRTPNCAVPTTAPKVNAVPSGHCKSVAKATQVRILDLPPQAQKGP